MNQSFSYLNGELHAEHVPIKALAQTYGTPLYIYSRGHLQSRWRAFDQAFGDHPHLICYAVKTNSNLGVLGVLARLGAGFDIVSIGELERVMAAGGTPSKVVFSGVAKKPAEIAHALTLGIKCFNVESEAELERIQSVAQSMNLTAPISLRVNPDVDAKTHPYISTGLKDNKFGIAIEQAPAVYTKAAAMSHIQIVGVDCHIGSQLIEIQPFVDALERVLALVETLKTQGIFLHHLDLGGGLGIQYHQDAPPEIATYVSALLQTLHKHAATGYEIILEPGRAIAGNAGVLITEVEYLKLNDHKNFAIVDAGMNDLIRPALYSAWQNILPVDEHPQGVSAVYDIVGPVCETGDFLGKERALTLKEGSLLAVMSSGAYGFVMASNYNTRGRPAEVMVDGDRAYLVRERETTQSLYALEHLLPDIAHP